MQRCFHFVHGYFKFVCQTVGFILPCTSFYGGSTPSFSGDKLRVYYICPFQVPCRLGPRIPSGVWPRVFFFHESQWWYDCQCLGFLTCTQMLTHAMHTGAVQTQKDRESALKIDWEKNLFLQARNLGVLGFIYCIFSVGGKAWLNLYITRGKWDSVHLVFSGR